MVYHLASLPLSLFNVTQVIFEKFSNGLLKGQRVVKARTKDSKPLDLKGSNFKCLRGIEQSTVEKLLQSVSDGKLSMSELGTKCIEIKQLNKIKTCFVKGTNSETSIDASQKYPSFTTSEQLLSFKRLSFNSPKIPDEFMKFCRAAVDSESRVSSPLATVDNDKMLMLTQNNCCGMIWQTELAKINPGTLNEVLRSVSMTNFFAPSK